MTQDKIAALLGRPLSSAEQSNFSTLLELAQSRVSDMFCVDICQKVETRRFPVRLGYKTLNVPIFTEIDSVTLDGVTVTDFEVRQNSKTYGDWYNSIVFTKPFFQKTVLTQPVVEIKADWGFATIPADVQLLIAEVFGILTDPLESDLIKLKQVEDFRLTLNDKTKQQAFAERYAGIIAKYSGCVTSSIESGSTNHRRWGLGYDEHLYYL